MTVHYYKYGEQPFYTLSGEDGAVREGYRFDRGTKRFVADLAEIAHRLYIAPEEVDPLTRAEFRQLAKGLGSSDTDIESVP